jgi:DNA-directed RNA polymerase subunit RPC12/RpoP
MANQVGKRYVCTVCGAEFIVTRGGYRCEACGTEILCTKPADGDPVCCENEMELQEPNKEKSSD